ncbi:hypothetical protein ACWC4A_12855 [Streptomyces mirabilis]
MAEYVHTSAGMSCANFHVIAIGLLPLCSLFLHRCHAAFCVASDDLVLRCAVLEELADRVPGEVLDHPGQGEHHADSAYGDDGPHGRTIEKLEEHGLLTLFAAVGKTRAASAIGLCVSARKLDACEKRAYWSPRGRDKPGNARDA